MVALPAAVGPARLTHIEEQGHGQPGGAVEHQIHRRALVGSGRPAPEGEALGLEGEGIEGRRRRGRPGREDGGEELALVGGGARGTGVEAGGLMGRQPLLPGQQLVPQQGGRQGGGRIGTGSAVSATKEIPLAGPGGAAAHGVEGPPERKGSPGG